MWNDTVEDEVSRGRLRNASLVACGLFVLEDPGIVAVRQRLRPLVGDGGIGLVLLDVMLATVMIAYNFAASRYVIRIASAGAITHAVAELDRRRRERIAATHSRIVRTARTAAHDANPFVLIGRAAERVGEAAERTARTAERHGRRRLGRLLTELATVNIFGVPGAGLERATHGACTSRRDTLRHCVLFVASWFAGARIIEHGLDALTAVPLVAGSIHGALRLAGSTFATLTDVTHPAGVAALAGIVVFVLRYSTQVERLAAAHDGRSVRPEELASCT
jgi:hypothetical protein